MTEDHSAPASEERGGNSGGGGGKSKNGIFSGTNLADLTNNFSQSIATSLHEVFNHNFENSLNENLMDMGKFLYKSCNSCGNSFSIFQRKERKRCSLCMLNFCQTCLQYNEYLRVYQCRRCVVFKQTPLEKEALNSLRIRDLKWFLASRNVPIDTYNEKEELVNLILAIANNSSRNLHQSRRSSATTSSSASLDATSVPPPPESSQPNPESEPTPAASSSTSHSPATSLTTFNLCDITEECEIKKLSIRQLKLLLARNFVDFKGCVERDELISKVTLLWLDKKLNDKIKDDIDNEDIVDENTCKICMENVIDCVLLECGHMLTCTNCGKILNECPVCRQFVTRVVHVFKG